jgi:uncharacterized protein
LWTRDGLLQKTCAQWVLIQAYSSARLRYGEAMLELRPSCECCDIDLPPQSTIARICSFECTFCATCAQDKLQGLCPNCGGELVTRPRRPAAALKNNPASERRVFNPQGCEGRVESDASTQAP